MTSALELRQVSKVYGSGPNEVHALRDVDLSVERGELVAIMGPSGSGKSTLLTIAGSLEEATSGEVLVDGVDLATVSRSERARMRRRSIGYVFQDFNLLPGLTAVENVTLPLELDGIHAKAARAAGLEAMERARRRGACRSLRRRAVGRRAPAGCDRPRDRRRARIAARGRADRRAGLRERRVRDAPAAGRDEAGRRRCRGDPRGAARPPGPTASSSCATAESSTRRSHRPGRSRSSLPVSGDDDARAPPCSARTEQRRNRRAPPAGALGVAPVPPRVAPADPGARSPHRRGRGRDRQRHDRLQLGPDGRCRVRLGQSTAPVRRRRSAPAGGGSRRRRGTLRDGRRHRSPLAGRAGRRRQGRVPRPGPARSVRGRTACAPPRQLSGRARARSPSPTAWPRSSGSSSGRRLTSTAAAGPSSASSRTQAI